MTQKSKSPQPQYLTDASGKRSPVVLTVAEYEAFLEDLDDLAAVAERRGEPRISLDELEGRLRADGLLN